MPGERHRRLERAVAAADDEHMLAPVLRWIVEAVDDLGQILARYAQSPRRAPPSCRQEHRMRAAHPDRRDDLEARGQGRDPFPAILQDRQGLPFRVTRKLLNIRQQGCRRVITVTR